MKGKFEELKKYILENATKLSNGTPIFSARYFAQMIEQAKKEYPHGDDWRQKDKWFKKWFGEQK